MPRPKDSAQNQEQANKQNAQNEAEQAAAAAKNGESTNQPLPKKRKGTELDPSKEPELDPSKEPEDPYGFIKKTKKYLDEASAVLDKWVEAMLPACFKRTVAENAALRLYTTSDIGHAASNIRHAALRLFERKAREGHNNSKVQDPELLKELNELKQALDIVSIDNNARKKGTPEQESYMATLTEEDALKEARKFVNPIYEATTPTNAAPTPTNAAPTPTSFKDHYNSRVPKATKATKATKAVEEVEKDVEGVENRPFQPGS
jgi:hypothetical protein